ncbi:unnamed protein product [Citrullus colocynthis]|uniref:Secreted protein n=1 Tax=Citrullus colocynthis TaxID=252529 RepID=A0ABP0Y5Q7_9ROSI
MHILILATGSLLLSVCNSDFGYKYNMMSSAFTNTQKSYNVIMLKVDLSSTLAEKIWSSSSSSSFSRLISRFQIVFDEALLRLRFGDVCIQARRVFLNCIRRTVRFYGQSSALYIIMESTNKDK